MERFSKYVVSSDKAGTDIAQMITKTFGSHAIPLSDSRPHGYDNGANISGKHNVAQPMIKEQFPTVVFSPCGCHTHDLCCNHAAECIPEAITNFRSIQLIYTLFSCSSKR